MIDRHGTLSKQAIAALRKVRLHILEEPKRLNMDAWVLRRSDFLHKPAAIKDSCAPLCKPYEFAKCGTAGCIAGWVTLLFNENEKDDLLGQFLKESASGFASRYLGLTGDYSQLFFPSSWDAPYGAKYENSKTPEEKAKVAAAYINYFIKTRGPRPKIRSVKTNGDIKRRSKRVV